MDFWLRSMFPTAIIIGGVFCGDSPATCNKRLAAYVTTGHGLDMKLATNAFTNRLIERLVADPQGSCARRITGSAVCYLSVIGAKTVRNVSALTAGSAGTDGRARMISRDQYRHPLSGQAPALAPCPPLAGLLVGCRRSRQYPLPFSCLGMVLIPVRQRCAKTLCQSFHRIAIGAAFAECQPQVLAVQAAQGCCRHCSKGFVAGSAKTALHSPRLAIGYRILCTPIQTGPVFSSTQFNRRNRGFIRRATGQNPTDL